jgi:hypothetical protein
MAAARLFRELPQASNPLPRPTSRTLAVGQFFSPVLRCLKATLGFRRTSSPWNRVRSTPIYGRPVRRLPPLGTAILLSFE